LPTLLVPSQFATIQSALAVAQSGDIVDASSTSASQAASIGLRSVTVRFGTGAADIFNIDWSTATFGLIGSALHFGPKSGYFNNGAYHVEFYDLEKINIKTGSGADSITTGDFDDTVSLGAGDDQFDTRTGRASVDGGPGVDGWTADLSASSVGITLNLATALLTQDIGGGNFVAGVERLHLTTGSGNDSIVTLSQALPDWISTGAGDDTVTVAGGSDTIDMGAGSNDFLFVDWSASTFSVVTRCSASGADTIYAGAGDDYLEGGAGASSVLAGEAGTTRSMAAPGTTT
jgi:Ca2+-binding RTX toxin-like protein